jgi:hypothetical protein
MKYFVLIILGLISILAVGCQKATPVCPPVTGTPEYLTIAPEALPSPTPAPEKTWVVIGRNEIQVDKVVEGSLCNDDWSGTVYVGCNVQVYAWQEEPTFLKNCQLNIDPQAVVYVAYHNNTAYYTGCSCHTGITPEP